MPWVEEKSQTFVFEYSGARLVVAIIWERVGGSEVLQGKPGAGRDLLENTFHTYFALGSMIQMGIPGFNSLTSVVWYGFNKSE